MTHIWLMSPGEPPGEDGLPDFLRRQLSDPRVLKVPGWLSAVTIWFYTWLYQRQLAPVFRQLPGPTEHSNSLEQQAILLERHLGRKKYRCKAVFRYSLPDAAEVAAGIGRGHRVILLPLQPHRGPARSSQTAAAAAELRRREAAVVSLPSFPRHPGFIDALAETLRAALADLPAPQQTDYEVLFSAPLPPRHRRMPAESRAELEEVVRAVVSAVGLVRPHHLGFIATLATLARGEPDSLEQIAATGQRGAAAVVVPLALPLEGVGTLVSLDRQLAQAAREAGVPVLVRAPTLGGRPTFTRALADLIRQAEQDAGWKKAE